MTKTSSVHPALAAQNGHEIGKRLAGVALDPPSRGGREESVRAQLVQVRLVEQVLRSDAGRAKLALPNPPTNRLGIVAQPACGLRDRDHEL